MSAKFPAVLTRPDPTTRCQPCWSSLLHGSSLRAQDTAVEALKVPADYEVELGMIFQIAVCRRCAVRLAMLILELEVG